MVICYLDWFMDSCFYWMFGNCGINGIDGIVLIVLGMSVIVLI